MPKTLLEELEAFMNYREEIITKLRDKGLEVSDETGFKTFARHLATLTGMIAPEELSLQYDTLANLTSALEQTLAQSESVLKWALLEDFQPGGWRAIAEAILQLDDVNPEPEPTPDPEPDLIPVTVNLTGDTYITEGLFVYDYDSGELIYEALDQQDSYTFEVPYDTRIEISLGENIDDYGLIDLDTGYEHNIAAEEFPIVIITEPQTLNYEVTAKTAFVQGTYSSLYFESTDTFSEELNCYSDELVSKIQTSIWLQNGLGRALNGTYYIEVLEAFASVYVSMDGVDGFYRCDADLVGITSGLYTDWGGFTAQTLSLHEHFHYSGEESIYGTAYLGAEVFALKLEGDYTGATAIEDGNDWIPITDSHYDGEYTYLLSENWNDENNRPSSDTSGNFKVYF